MIGRNMVATTMYWPIDQYQKIKEIANWENKPKAQVVRELVDKSLATSVVGNGNAKQVFEAMAKLQIKGGHGDLAKNHDHYAWD